MIDWMTLRLPIGQHFIGDALDRFTDHCLIQETSNNQGEVVHRKLIFDVDSLASDSVGLFWQIKSDGTSQYLVIGGSPASIEHQNNVFGSDDLKHCAAVLIGAASKALNTILPPARFWKCSRIDYTHNYALQSHAQVKHALRELLKGDSVRQKATRLKGDSVYWGKDSDFIGGKAYDKGSQLALMVKRNKSRAAPEHIELASRLLRLELTLKARWFRQYTEKNYGDTAAWLDITPDQLMALHTKFFGQFIGDTEVTDMTDLLRRLEFVAPTKGRALAAHRTWALIRAIGYEATKSSMPERTFMLHQKYLKDAGLSAADLQASNIIPFRRDCIRLAAPVTSWEELKRAA